MRRFQMFGAALLTVLAASTALAAPQSVTLQVEGMTCPTCPITLKKALMKQPGVTSVAVHYDKKQLVVGFDDAKTSTSALIQTTSAVGFPSQAVKASSR